MAAHLADADLAELARLWHSLPPTARAEILALAAKSAAPAAGRVPTSGDLEGCR